jgi:hypothetical protein
MSQWKTIALLAVGFAVGVAADVVLEETARAVEGSQGARTTLVVSGNYSVSGEQVQGTGCKGGYLGICCPDGFTAVGVRTRAGDDGWSDVVCLEDR